MKVLPIILMCFFIRELSAYNIKNVRRVSDYMEDAVTRFDAQGNIYFGGGDKLYRINASDKMDTIEGEFRCFLWNHVRDVMLVSNRGNVFMMDRDTLKVVKAGSMKSEKVAEPVLEFHVDNNYNLFYVREKKHDPPNYTPNVNMIRPYSETPVQILHASDFRSVYPGSVVIKSDKSGNIYMPMHFRNSTVILVLTNETLQAEQPVPKYLNITETETGELREVYDFVIDDENNLWTMCSDRDSVVAMKLINDNWTEILGEKDDTGFRLHESRLLNIKGRIFVIIRGISEHFISNIYYIEANDNAIKLTGSDSVSGFSAIVKWAADDEGQIYFYDSEKMLTLKPNEKQLIPVEIDKPVVKAAVDWNNNVWIAATSDTGSERYHLKKGETISELIDGAAQNCTWSFSSMAANFVTKRIYFTCLHTAYN